MRKISLIFGTLILASVTSSVVFADTAHPCKSLEAACKAAGFYQGGSGSGKGLLKNCIEPLANGKTVAGVTVDKTDAQNCKVKIDSMQ